MLPKICSGKTIRRVPEAVGLDRDRGDIMPIEDVGFVDARPRTI